VRIYDTGAEQRIVRIDRPEQSPRADLFRCNLLFETDTTLVVAWGNWVKVCVIKEREPVERLADPSLPPRRGEIVFSFDTEGFLCGAAPFGPNLLFLIYDDPDLPVGNNRRKKSKRPPAQGAAKGIAPRPELRVCKRDGAEVACDSLNIRDHSKWFATDYRLEIHPQMTESIHYILSPLEIIVAKPCDDDDYVAWLLKRFRYGEALNCVRNLNCKRAEHSLQAVGEKYLAHLVEVGDHKSAAFHFKEILGTSAPLWEKWIGILEQAGQLRWVVDQLPAGPAFTLSPAVYRTVLCHLVATDPRTLLVCLKSWPPTLYPTMEVLQEVAAALAKLKPPVRPQGDGATDAHSTLTLALATLYEATGQYSRALDLYLSLRRSDVFDFIQRHGLFDSVADKVLTFMELDLPRSLQLLVENVDRLPVELVVSQLAGRSYFEHLYLDRLFKTDVRRGAAYHNRQVELYAEHEPECLLPFLRSSEHINWKTALQVCKAKNMVRETVFVMGRMGDTQNALRLIMTKLGDVKEAVTFITEHHDDDLFDLLIELCLKSAAMVGDLLDHLASVEGAMSTIDPLKLINKIPAGVKIPGLRDKLGRILRNASTTRTLKDGCREVLRKDLVAQEKELLAGHARAVRLAPVDRCLTCHDLVRPPHGAHDRSTSAVAFACGHTYHIGCYQQQIVAAMGTKAKPPDLRGNEAWDVRGFLAVQGARPTCLQCSALRRLKPRRAVGTD
jgi:hypothetical protein